MTDTARELRQLASEIEKVGRASPSWSIAYKWVNTLTDHLQAVARVHETRTFENEEE